ncbi:MAG: hypothetical protein H3C62_08470 [Gemmatimonadaceae bacterium]|nr:hypothetical protein [Gemmatimonadaceae bacterium]
MKHFFRTTVHPDAVLSEADAFFPTIGLKLTHTTSRSRTYQGVVGTPEVPATLVLSVKMEGGHYTFIEGATDQIGESRLDRNVKKFFVQLHRLVDARHEMVSSF